MRRRRLKKLLKRLHELQHQRLTRDELLLKLGAARKEAGRAYALVNIQRPEKDQAVTPESFTFSLNRSKLRLTRRREGHYLLRSNLNGEDPAQLWQYYLQLTEVEQAFKELKGDLAIRPIYHQTEARIEAHIFVAFVAYCLKAHAQTTSADLGAGADPAGRAREILHHPNGRCAFAHHRWAPSHSSALHPARAGSQNPVATTQVGITCPTLP